MSPEETTPKRADAGIPRLTARDASALEWLEDVRVMWETDVALLLGRLSGRVDAVSPTSVRTAIRRWARLGLVRAEKIYAHQPRMVWLTETGAKLAGARTWREPGKGVARHTAEVARVRLWLMDRGLAGEHVTGWISERRWRQQHAEAIRQGAHVPDAIAVTQSGAQFAIEVELSDKGPGRTLDVALRLTNMFARIVYLVPEGSQTERTARGALEQALQAHRGRVGDGQINVMALPAPSWAKPQVDASPMVQRYLNPGGVR